MTHFDTVPPKMTFTRRRLIPSQILKMTFRRRHLGLASEFPVYYALYAKHIKIDVKGYICLPKKGGIALNDQGYYGGGLHITCNNLAMEKGSYIAANGQIYGGGIYINVKNQIITKYGMCYILANGTKCGGRITVKNGDQEMNVDGNSRDN